VTVPTTRRPADPNPAEMLPAAIVPGPTGLARTTGGDEEKPDVRDDSQMKRPGLKAGTPRFSDTPPTDSK